MQLGRRFRALKLWMQIRYFGAEGIAIAREDEIEDAVERTLAASGSVVLEVRSSLEAISAYTTLEKLRGGQ